MKYNVLIKKLLLNKLIIIYKFKLEKEIENKYINKLYKMHIKQNKAIIKKKFFNPSIILNDKNNIDTNKNA